MGGAGLLAWRAISRYLPLRREMTQAHYLNAIDSKQLIFATGEAGCGKHGSVRQRRQKLLIHKDVERIIVTRPVRILMVHPVLPGDIAGVLRLIFVPSTMSRLNG